MADFDTKSDEIEDIFEIDRPLTEEGYYGTSPKPRLVHPSKVNKKNPPSLDKLFEGFASIIFSLEFSGHWLTKKI